MRGYFGIGVFHTKTETNIGTLMRSAYVFGASFVFTVGRRYQKQPSDTPKTWRHIPLYHWSTLDELVEHGRPYDCQLVGVELHGDAVTLQAFQHPQRCIYLLGAEDHGLSTEALAACDALVQIPSARCLNVAVAGSIVMYDRQENRR